MGHYNLEYPKEPTNTVKRYNAHAVYALKSIHTIVNTCQILHVSFNTPSQSFPVTLPMIGHMGSFDRPSADLGDPLDLYLHGYVSSRLMNTGRGSGGSDGEEGTKGMPVCISAAQVDGLVLTLTSFSHNYNYRSTVLFGHATIVEDDAEKLYAMELITNSVVPDRWRHTRLPPTKAEIQSTGILRVKIASGSAKISAGQAHDDKQDMDNEPMLNSTWTGVLPIHQTMGQPVPSPYNRVDLPAYISEFVSDYSADNETIALDASKGDRRAL